MATKNVEYIVGLRDKFTSKMQNMQNTTNRFNNSIGGTIAKFASLAAVGGVIVSAVNKMREFEEKMDNLQAITGATGDQLDYLKRKAIELGAATGLGAANTVEAFKLIASAKPELLENAEALAAVTKEASILSKASGLSMQDAAIALTSALNQFNMTADQSARIINVLGAGAKFSAAEIPDLTDSLKEFGVAANSMGISVEQSAAMVETLSEKGLVGRRSGVQLRNILIRLAASGDKNLNPAIVGVNKALENLSVIEKDTTKLTEMFGMESMVAAQALIQNRKRLDELTKSMTGTNTTYEQAQINSDNLNTDIKVLAGTWEKFVLGIESGTGGISQFLRISIKGVTALINLVDDAYSSAEDKGKKFADSEFELYKKRIDQYDDQVKKLEEIDKLTTHYNKRLDEFRKKKTNLETGGFALFPFIERRKSSTEISKYESLIESANKLKQSILNPKVNSNDILGEVFGDTTSESAATRITAASPKVFNINIDRMIENFTVETTSIKEGATDIREGVRQILQEALTDVQAAAL